MTNFYNDFKTAANNRHLSSYHMVAHCVYKATTAKNENKEAILHCLLAKTFKASGKKTPAYTAVYSAARRLQNFIRPYRKHMGDGTWGVYEIGLFDGHSLSYYMDEQQQVVFRELLNKVMDWGR